MLSISSERSALSLESVSRRNVVKGLASAFAVMPLPNVISITPTQKPVVLTPSCSALLILDYQRGLGDQTFARAAAERAVAALEAGRQCGMLIVFSKVKLRPGYPDVSMTNKAFASVKTKNLMPPEASALIQVLAPRPSEILVDKDRFSAFSGNDLKQVLGSAGIHKLVLAGVATSGVVLSTFTLASDEDYELVILSDACADPKPTLHQELIADLFPRSANVLTVHEWANTLGVAKCGSL